MGFSVTAAHVVFLVALMGAVGAAISSHYTTASDVEEARRLEAARAERLVHGRISLDVVSCSDACAAGTREVILDITNAGTIVIDHRNLSYVIDGRTYLAADVSSASITAPAAVAGTDLVLPGETLRVTLPQVVLDSSYTTGTLPVQVVSAEGVVGRR